MGILLTHFHVDHIGSAAELAAHSGAAVLAHRWDAPVHPPVSDRRCDQEGLDPTVASWAGG